MFSDFQSNQQIAPFSLSVENLSYTYPTTKKKVLTSLSFSAESGKVYAIIGSSGSGKSTLLKLIAGMVTTTTGTIALSSEKGAVFDSTHLYQYVTLLSQDDMLLPWRTVESNICLPLELGAQASQKKDRNAHIVQEVLELFELQPYRSFYPKELSGGLKKLTALARAYVENRPILLLDEPFSSIDFILRSNLYLFLQKLASISGKLIIYVTHDLYDCEKLSDSIFFLKNGIFVPKTTLNDLQKMRGSLYG